MENIVGITCINHSLILYLNQQILCHMLLITQHLFLIEDLGKEIPYNNLKDTKIFVCFILSHGNNCDEIHTKDGTVLLKESILDKLHNIATLNGKTKIIVIQVFTTLYFLCYNSNFMPHSA